MTEQKQMAARAAFGWRSLGVTVVVMLAAIGLGMLLIPQLSRRAAIQGSVIAFGALLFGRLGTWWYLRSKKAD